MERFKMQLTLSKQTFRMKMYWSKDNSCQTANKTERRHCGQLSKKIRFFPPLLHSLWQRRTKSACDQMVRNVFDRNGVLQITKQAQQATSCKTRSPEHLRQYDTQPTCVCEKQILSSPSTQYGKSFSRVSCLYRRIPARTSRRTKPGPPTKQLDSDRSHRFVRSRRCFEPVREFRFSGSISKSIIASVASWQKQIALWASRLNGLSGAQLSNCCSNASSGLDWLLNKLRSSSKRDSTATRWSFKRQYTAQCASQTNNGNFRARSIFNSLISITHLTHFTPSRK